MSWRGDGAEITIANLGATEQYDGRHDFYLHYGLAEAIPEVPGVPDDCGASFLVNSKTAADLAAGIHLRRRRLLELGVSVKVQAVG